MATYVFRYAPSDGVLYSAAGWNLENIGAAILRYSLVAVLLWIGALKFTAYEAENIKPLVTNSPLMAWAVRALGLQTLAAIIG